MGTPILITGGWGVVGQGIPFICRDFVPLPALAMGKEVRKWRQISQRDTYGDKKKQTPDS